MIIELHNSQNYMSIEQITMQNLPRIGYVAIMGGHPIACGFLRRVEGGFAQIDTLASNAFFGSKIRNDGITLIVDELINEAKRLKLRGIISMTNDQGVMTRAKAIGFHEVQQSIIALPIVTSA
jgi:hypothetical protein